nr:VPLPA-CTERM sorting domain-containing protein [Desulfobacula sp.]
MKKISISFMALALLAVLMIASAAHATMSANILYTETELSEGLWQYNFTVENTSLAGESHPYLWKVALDFENNAYVTLLNNPGNWTVGTYIGSLPDITDYVEMYSESSAFDILPGSLLSGLSFTADYRLGEITYEAWFSNHGTFEEWTSVSGTASAVPVPAAVWLLGSGLIGLAGICRKNR